MAKNRKVITGLQSRYTKLPNEIFEVVALLTKPERRIYWDAIGVYTYFINSAENFHPGIQVLLDGIGRSKSSIENSLKLLIALGFLTKPPYRRGKRDVYTFVHPSQWSVWSRLQSDLNPASSDTTIRSAPSCQSGHNYKEEGITNGKPTSLQPENETPWLSEALANVPEATPDPHAPCSSHILSSSADLMAELGIAG